MKICHIITALDFGGAERLLLSLAQEQCANHEFHIIYLKDKNAMQDLFPASVTIHYVPLNWNCSNTIRRIIIKIMPDVVHTHLGHADWFGLWAIRGLSVKKYCTMHNIWYKFNILDYIIFGIYIIIFRVVAHDCTVICISKSVEEHIARRIRVPASRRILIYNAVPPLLPKQQNSRVSSRNFLHLNHDFFYVLFVGRFEPQKSIHTLLEAAALLKDKYPNIHFLLVGDGSLKEEMEKKSNNLKLDKTITFIGQHSKPEVFMQAADVLALPSIFEGLGIVILEAFRAKIPVISTNLEGPKELIKHGTTGFLFEPQQPSQLARYIENMYINPDLKEKMGENAYAEFEHKYDIKQYVIQLENLYEST
jgi:glycosyltransferase involved in cell wall biosynthesis